VVLARKKESSGLSEGLTKIPDKWAVLRAGQELSTGHNGEIKGDLGATATRRETGPGTFLFSGPDLPALLIH